MFTVHNESMKILRLCSYSSVIVDSSSTGYDIRMFEQYNGLNTKVSSGDIPYTLLAIVCPNFAKLATRYSIIVFESSSSTYMLWLVNILHA